MLNEHSKVGIAQTVFYVPIAPLAIYLLYRNAGKRPRMAWIPLVPFSLIRLSGGIVVICFEHKNSVGLIIAALVLLNVGVVPLIIESLGFLRLIFARDFEKNHVIFRFAIASRLLFLAAVVLLVSGASLVGQYQSPSDETTGLKLEKAGYIVFAVILAILCSFQLHLWAITSRLSAPSMVVLKGLACAMPFLIVRTVYAFLGIYSNSLYSKWDALYGSAPIFACMALLMEYIVICIFIYIGFNIPSNRGTDDGVAPGKQENGTVEQNGRDLELQ